MKTIPMRTNRGDFKFVIQQVSQLLSLVFGRDSKTGKGVEKLYSDKKEKASGVLSFWVQGRWSEVNQVQGILCN